MELWTKGIKRSQKDLLIKDGVLVKCPVKEGTFTIPDDMTVVRSDAFEGCENVKINYSEKDIETRLSNQIFTSLKSLTYENDNWTKPYTELENLGPCMAVFGMTAPEIDRAIKVSLEKIEEKNPDIKWKYIEIDIDAVNDINAQIESKGRDNLVTFNDDSVSTFLNIPFLFHSPVQQLGRSIQYANDLISKEGFGVIFIKNLNKDNYKNLPHNFIYSLVKSHSFCKVRLSPKWQVIIEVGDGAKLDAPGGVRFSFNGNWYRGVEIEEFLKEMKREGKIVEADNETNTKGKFDDLFKDDDPEENIANVTKKNETPTSSSIDKEIDWEERHFQICLALISRADLTSYHNNTVASREIAPAKIIKKADEMVEALKKHHEEQNKI